MFVVYHCQGKNGKRYKYIAELDDIGRHIYGVPIRVLTDCLTTSRCETYAEAQKSYSRV